MKPSVSDIEKISNISQPILRNLQITQCYFELSQAFSVRSGYYANWCTFAAWASKQAGQTIRREDLIRTLESKLKLEPELEQALHVIATIAQKLGSRQSFEQIKLSALGSILESVANHASDAVSRGNKKVFDEIAWQFAHFLSICLNDPVYDESNIQNFCRQLMPGDLPNGQAYLQQAFSRYYASFFIEDPKKRAELQLLANIEIGFHEQNRLQPEIQESLNAALMIDPQKVKKRLSGILFPHEDYTGRLWLFFQQIFQRTDLLDKAIAALVAKAQVHIRKVLTYHLMTLHLPPNNYLRLGLDLTTNYPSYLQELVNEDLLHFLTRIDPTENSIVDSGATDWASLPERLHYITDLFRCYFDTKELFEPPFTQAQTSAIKAGQLPSGRL